MRHRRISRLRHALLAAAVAACGTIGSATTAHAGWHEFWHSVHVGYHRNNAWPHPFLEAAAAQTRAPFEVMTHKGWKLHNTIGHELFRSSDGVLTPAGRGRVHWIASQAPEHRRVVHVLRGHSQQETDARVASVRAAIDKMHLAGPRPQVFVTDVPPATVGGAWANQISRQWLESLPAPKLPASSSGSGGAGSP